MLERLKEGTLSRYQEVMLSLVTDDHPRAENGNVKIFDQSAFLLATMGAENMHFVDGGIIQHSTRDRFPGALGEHHMVGRIKSEALRDQLYKKFPYGNFEAYGGYVRLDKESLESGDILLRELAEACDILVEVVDNPLMKLAIRQWLAKEYPEKPLIFMGDVGIAGSFAGVERAGIENHFNQSINNKKLEAMIARLAGAKDSTSAHDAALRAVNEMLGAHFPYDHIVQFLLNTVDSQNNQPVLPFWAQTPIAASASSIVATLLILHNIIGNGLTGKNYTIQDVPSTFVNFSPESLQAIGQMRHMLEFPC